MIAQANAEPATQEHQNKERDLKPVEPEMPEVEWNRSKRKHERADEKRTGRPIDAVERKTGHHICKQGVGAKAEEGAASTGQSFGKVYYSSVSANAE